MMGTAAPKPNNSIGAETIRKLYLILFALQAKYFIFMENIGISAIKR